MARVHLVNLHLDMYMDEKPVPMDQSLVSTIQNICKQKGLNYRMMYSGAGHDSQLMAKYVPTAMAFVPSIDGISHSPHEHTHLEDLVVGVEALIHTLVELAY